MLKEDCTFCKIARGEIPAKKVFENDDVICFLDINPVAPGHSLIITKEHFENIFDIDKTVLNKMMENSKKAAHLLKDKLKCDGVNILNASGAAAQQSVFHIHFHVIPRYNGDGLDIWFHGRSSDQYNLDEVLKKLTS